MNWPFSNFWPLLTQLVLVNVINFLKAVSSKTSKQWLQQVYVNEPWSLIVKTGFSWVGVGRENSYRTISGKCVIKTSPLCSQVFTLGKKEHPAAVSSGFKYIFLLPSRLTLCSQLRLIKGTGGYLIGIGLPRTSKTKKPEEHPVPFLCLCPLYVFIASWLKSTGSPRKESQMKRLGEDLKSETISLGSLFNQGGNLSLPNAQLISYINRHGLHGTF